MHSNKAIKQFANHLLTLSMENGHVSSEKVKAVLATMAKHEPKAEIKPILKQYLRVVRREVAKTEAVVEHVGPLSSNTLQSLIAKLSSIAGKSVTSVTVENPSLIAGLRVRLGDDVYDSSVAGRLAVLANEVIL